MKNLTLTFALFFLSFSAVCSAGNVNLALNKSVSAKVNDMNGSSSNDEIAYRMTDGDATTWWESANSYKHSVLIDLGASYKITKIVIKWVDGQACSSCDLNFGQSKESMENVWSANNLTETVESVHENLDVNARFFELVLRGRIVGGKPYKISEIEIYGADNLALGKDVSAKVNDMNGSSSNDDIAYRMTDGALNTYWESLNSYRHSILIDLGTSYKITKVVIKWVDGQACNSCDLNFGESKESMVNVWSANGLTETVESVHDGFNETARFFELVLRGRIVSGKPYKISEIQLFNEGYTPPNPTPEEQQALDTITDRLTRKQVNVSFNDASVTSYSESMLEDGSWSDVNYDDEISADGWSPNSHLNRLKQMAICFRNPGSIWFENAGLRDQIELGLLYFKQRAPKATDNWWYNDIGGPQIYMVPVLLLKGYTPAEDLYEVSSYLKDKIDNYWGGGKNLSWIAEIAMYKGSSEDNFSIVSHAFEAMSSTLVIVPNQGDEGIKIDGSFHQHHAQLYSGGYGLSMTTDISESIALSLGTLFEGEFTPEKKEIYRKLLLDGVLLLSYRKTIDFGSIGRNISRNPNTDYTTISTSVLDRETTNDPENATLYQAWKNHIENAAAFPLSAINKHFWKSDIMTQHGDSFYLSAKIISQRTYGTESLNNENLKGYNLPLGATNILTSGLEYDRVYPVWDWTRIPGTTAVRNQDSTRLDGYLIGSNLFGGGVSNERNGIMAYDHNYRGLQARKAYFFIDEMLLCMGAGISFGPDEEVVTSVNQSLLSGNVLVNNGTTQSLPAQTSLAFNDLNWVYQNKVGYIFPSPANVAVGNLTQTGSWRDINGTGSTAAVSKEVFSLWFNHGSAPTNAQYSYIVVPDKTASEFEMIAGNHGFVIVGNNPTLQAVRRSTVYGVVFYGPGSITMDDGLRVSSNKEALVLIDVNDTEYEISVSDPTYSQSEIQLTVNRKLMSGTVSGDSTVLLFTLPSGDYTGSTVTGTYREERSTAGIDRQEAGPVQVAPNPSKTEATVYFTPDRFHQLELVDITGKSVRKEVIAAGQSELVIPLAVYDSGTYIVKLSGNKEMVTRKLLIVN